MNVWLLIFSISVGWMEYFETIFKNCRSIALESQWKH